MRLDFFYPNRLYYTVTNIYCKRKYWAHKNIHRALLALFLYTAFHAILSSHASPELPIGKVTYERDP